MNAALFVLPAWMLLTALLDDAPLNLPPERQVLTSHKTINRKKDMYRPLGAIVFPERTISLRSKLAPPKSEKKQMHDNVPTGPERGNVTEASSQLDKMANPHPKLMHMAQTAWIRWEVMRDAMAAATGESAEEIERRVREWKP